MHALCHPAGLDAYARAFYHFTAPPELLVCLSIVTLLKVYTGSGIICQATGIFACLCIEGKHVPHMLSLLYKQIIEPPEGHIFNYIILE